MFSLFPFPFLYAETHFRIIPRFWSRLFKKEPEIISDTIWRIAPGNTIPLLFLIKDADQFPIMLDRAIVTIKYDNFERNLIFDFDAPIFNKLWWRIEYLSILEHEYGKILEICTEIYYKDNNNNSIKCVNDNYYPVTPNLLTYIAKQPMPRLEGWKYGDMHLHSIFTDDQIEFAAPIKVTSEMARIMGLDFLGISDHSYDLDDSIDSYLINDPAKPKWQKYKKEVEKNNLRSEMPTIIPGFEVSIANNKGNSVHLQVFNSDELYDGSSDSGEIWLPGKPEWRLKDILAHLAEKSLACAAHIGEKPPFMQRLLLGRGHYAEKDLDNSALSFFQLANGVDHIGLNSAKLKWIKQLLKGRKVIPLAGSDSHGNFNLARNIVLPHLSMDISRRQLLGEFRTAVWSVKMLNSYEEIIDALKTGVVQITSGPVISVKNITTGVPIFGSTLKLKTEHLFAFEAKSSDEFGKISVLKVFYGDKLNGEYLYLKNNYKSLQIIEEIKLTNLSEKVIYIRFEVLTDKGFTSIASPTYICE